MHCNAIQTVCCIVQNYDKLNLNLNNCFFFESYMSYAQSVMRKKYRYNSPRLYKIFDEFSVKISTKFLTKERGRVRTGNNMTRFSSNTKTYHTK